MMSQTLKRPETPAVKSLRKEKNRQKTQTMEDKEAELVRGLKDSFPASDPVSVTITTTSGEPDKDAKAS